ncbi:MAG: hypothetical protein ABF296_06250, partial [Oceanococcaceae bacterium]
MTQQPVRGDIRGWALLVLVAIAACSGGRYDDPAAQLAAGDAVPDASPPGAPPPGGSECDAFFAAAVQPELDFCRTCHVPEGIGDVEEGRLFMLSSDPGEDYANLYAAWENLGGNNPVSRILLMASGTDQRSHTGGEPWPEDSEAYRNMQAQLEAFGEGACAPSRADRAGARSLALLGSKRGGHVWADFCAGQDDDAPLPVDPRTLVVTGANADKAVHFNIEWRDCRADPALIGEGGQPTTCGEYRALHALGEQVMRGNGAAGAGHFFAADSTGNDAPLDFTIAANEWNNLWRMWGEFARPADFDYLVSQRFGAPLSPTRNPYPLPGEDPNATDGGSGQLPISFTQTRTADGAWSGRIGLTCHGCHSGAAGAPADGDGLGVMYGSGNSLNDVAVVARDLGLAARSPIALFTLFGVSRGTNNASDVNIFALMEGFNPDPNLFGVLTSGSTGSMDTPP